VTTHSSLADSVLILGQHIKTQAIAATAVNGTAIDMKGWDGVLFIIPYGVFGTSATLNGLVQRDDNSGFNSATNIANSNLTQINAANANATAMIDIYQPQERYVRMQLTGQTNGVTTGCIAIQYRRAGVLPPTQDAAQLVRVVSG
jgi:hypothetical protein